MTAQTSKRIVAGLAFVLLGSTAALAADAQAFADRLKDAAAKSSVPMTFTAAESVGENVLVKGVVVGSGPEAATIGDVTFENVTGSNSEGWKATRVPFADIDVTEGDSQTNVTGIIVEGFQLAGSEGTSTLPGQSQYFFDSASVEALKVAKAGKEIFSLTGTDITTSVSSGSGAIATSFTLGDFKVDFAANPEEEASKTMQEVGYPQLSGTGSMEASWDPKTGELSLDPFQVNVEDAGEFTFAYQINGYTPAFAKSLADIQQQMAANPAAAESSGMAIIGLVSQLSLASLNIEFTDASLTGKLLDYYAKQNGVARDDLIAGLTAQLPPMLAALQNPEFQTKVTTAVETFLKDPKSLTISVDPDAPVAATQIIGAAMGAPQTLPTVLQLDVSANGAE